jgi:CRISPR-associated endonuclease/helicase Cas3
MVVAKRYETKNDTAEREVFYQTLAGHTHDSLHILNCHFRRNPESTKTLSAGWGIDHQQLMRNLFITVYLHDIGKLTHQFQDRIRKNLRSQKFPHPFFGFPAALEIFKTMTTSVLPLQGCPVIEPLTVLSHHSPLHDHIYRYSTIEHADPIEDEIIAFLNNIEKAHCDLGFSQFFDLDWRKDNEYHFINVLRDENSVDMIIRLLHPLGSHLSMREIAGEVVDLTDIARIKSIYTYFLAIIRLCDFYSSAHFSDYVERNRPEKTVLDSVLEVPDHYVNTFPELSTKQILGAHAPYQFQSHIQENAAPMSFLFAPCGRGKTEAALLWAMGVCGRFKKNRIVLAMPTQTTSNALADRFKEKLDDAGFNGKELVGLCHGKSFIKLKEDHLREKEEEIDELDKDELEEIKGETFKGSVFLKPLTVTTIDHLILSFVHGFRQADFACGNLQSAVIVFDEIHYYERQTLKQLVDLFSILRKMRIPHLLMSGTLPDFIVKRLEKDSEEGTTYSFLRDGKGLSFTPFRIEIFDSPLIVNGKVDEEILQEIKTHYSEGLNQFIILNTVRRAQNFYEALKDEIDNVDVCLLHSQFTHSDRAVRESSIIDKISRKKKRPVIVISTQVIEISLDISCDIMYTELAPMDSLGQRGGRLNRGAQSWRSQTQEYVMKVYPPENHLPYDEDIMEKTMEILKEGVYSYEDLKKACDSVYGDTYLEEFEETGQFEGDYGLLKFRGRDSLFEKCFLFGLRHREIAFSEDKGNRFVIRSEKQRKIDVIPWEYYKNNQDNLKVENQARVPLWWMQSDYSVHGEGNMQWFELELKQFKYRTRPYLVCKLPYTKDFGFDSSILEQEDKIGRIKNVI